MPLATLCFTGFSRDDQAKAQQFFAQANADSGGRFELANENDARAAKSVLLMVEAISLVPEFTKVTMMLSEEVFDLSNAKLAPQQREKSGFRAI